MENTSRDRFSFISLLVPGAAAVLIYWAVKSLVLHPLAKFPGPKYAAFTHWYQFYYDVIKRGRFSWELRRLHEKYGPVVRIGPNEVHVSDPNFYDELYTGNARKRNRDPFVVAGFGLPDAVLNSPDHDLHRMGRAALNPCFSKQAITLIEPVVQAKLEILCKGLDQLRQSRQSVNLEPGFMALTTDIITEYCFATSYNYLEQPNFSPNWLKATMGASEASLLGRYFTFLPSLMKSMSPWLVETLSPPMMQLVIYTRDQEKQVQAIKSGSHVENVMQNHRTIIHELIDSDLPASEKSVERLSQEAQTLVAAGSITTSFFLKTALYYILANPDICNRLVTELKQAIHDPKQLPATHELMQLPLLTAVVKEAGRMLPGAFCRLSRIAPSENLRCGKWVIPAGTSIGMSTWIQHNDPTIFPEPDKFKPVRWMDGKEDRKLERFLVPFSKGSRACLGINLAQVEMYLTLATLFRRFDFELFETDRSDMELAHEFFVPSSRTDSKGVRVIVKATSSV